MHQHPVHALLTPDPAESAPPADLTHIRLTVPSGLPNVLEVPGLGRSVLLSAATGRVRAWLEAESSDLAVDSAPQRQAFPQSARGDDPRAALSPLLIVLDGQNPVAVLPLVIHARTLLPRCGGLPGQGLELWIQSFSITAEAMRGPGAGSSFLELGWRRIDAGSDEFLAPLARPALRRRLVITTGARDQRKRRRVSAELDSDASSFDARSPASGGIAWRLTHD
ncbi:MAG: hypothetical protein RL885_20495 [Planctomycetota bacterium]